MKNDRYEHGNIGNRNAAIDTPKDRRIQIKCTAADLQNWQQAAGNNLTKWVTKTLNEQAKLLILNK